MADPLDVFRLDGKVAVLTGGASGMGEAAGELFAQAGAKIVLGDINLEGAQATADRITSAGGEAIAVEVDASDRAQMFALVNAGVDAFGKIDVMCNIAGINHQNFITDLTEDEIDRLLGINLKSVIWGSQAAVAAMKESGGGVILNVGSNVVDFAAPRYALYGMAKVGVQHLSKTLAAESGRYGIRVNCVAPGATVTAFTNKHLYDDEGNLDQEKYDKFLQAQQRMSPIGRIGEAIDQAWLMLYLASDAARFVTGQTIRANGGQSYT